MDFSALHLPSMCFTVTRNSKCSTSHLAATKSTCPSLWVFGKSNTLVVKLVLTLHHSLVKRLGHTAYAVQRYIRKCFIWHLHVFPLPAGKEQSTRCSRILSWSRHRFSTSYSHTVLLLQITALWCVPQASGEATL